MPINAKIQLFNKHNNNEKQVLIPTKSDTSTEPFNVIASISFEIEDKQHEFWMIQRPEGENTQSDEDVAVLRVISSMGYMAFVVDPEEMTQVIDLFQQCLVQLKQSENE